MRLFLSLLASEHVAQSKLQRNSNLLSIGRNLNTSSTIAVVIFPIIIMIAMRPSRVEGTLGHRSHLGIKV